MIQGEYKGFRELERKLGKIIRNMPRAAKTSVRRALQDTADIAVRLSPSAVSKCIRVELLKEPERNVLAGRVFTDTSITSFAPYVEFGTGLKVDDQGNKEAIRLKRAKQVPWYIHVSMVPESFARYGYPKETIGGQEYWVCDGMYPHPYMHPAAFQNEDKNAQIVADGLRALFKEAGL